MKIAIAQLNFTIGDFEQNTVKILNAIDKAEKLHAELLIFSELALCGYPPDDLLSYPAFEETQQQYLLKIIKATKNCAVILGALEKNPDTSGRLYYNSAFVIQNGQIEGIHRKELLPDYDVFNEERHFERGKDGFVVVVSGKKIAVTICEDIWNNGEERCYQTNPLNQILKENGADFFVNISASPFSLGKQSERIQQVAEKCKLYQLPGIYVNQVGANTDLIFDGRSFISNSNGDLYYECNAFKEDFYFFESNDLNTFHPKKRERDEMQLLHDALVCGIRDYFYKNGFKKAVLGSSGGIDSALVQTLAVEALGAENVTVLLMPSVFSSQHSIDDAVKLSENLGNNYVISPISELYDKFLETMSGIYGKTDFDLTEENLQSRIRGNLLMAYSNKKGALLLNTSNKSELAVGYSTLYGDLCGALSVIGDLYKTRVYELAKWMNMEAERIPENILIKEPSAELRHEQKDSDSLPSYEILDQIIFRYVEQDLSLHQIIAEGFDEQLVSNVIRLINQSEYKRFQAPPILRISKKSFGRGRVIPLTAKFKY